MNKLLNNLLGMYKQAKLNKKAEQQNLKQIFEEAMGNREPIIETANGVFYFEPKGDKIVFGTATNVGISQDYVFDYDFDISFDQNIQGMAEEVLEKEGYYTESSKKNRLNKNAEEKESAKKDYTEQYAKVKEIMKEYGYGLSDGGYIYLISKEQPKDEGFQVKFKGDRLRVELDGKLKYSGYGPEAIEDFLKGMFYAKKLSSKNIKLTKKAYHIEQEDLIKETNEEIKELARNFTNGFKNSWMGMNVKGNNFYAFTTIEKEDEDGFTYLDINNGEFSDGYGLDKYFHPYDYWYDIKNDELYKINWNILEKKLEEDAKFYTSSSKTKDMRKKAGIPDVYKNNAIVKRIEEMLAKMDMKIKSIEGKGLDYKKVNTDSMMPGSSSFSGSSFKEILNKVNEYFKTSRYNKQSSNSKAKAFRKLCLKRAFHKTAGEFEEMMKLKSTDPKLISYLAKEFGVEESTVSQYTDVSENAEELYNILDEQANKYGFEWDKFEYDEYGDRIDENDFRGDTDDLEKAVEYIKNNIDKSMFKLKEMGVYQDDYFVSSEYPNALIFSINEKLIPTETPVIYITNNTKNYDIDFFAQSKKSKEEDETNKIYVNSELGILIRRANDEIAREIVNYVNVELPKKIEEQNKKQSSKTKLVRKQAENKEIVVTYEGTNGKEYIVKAPNGLYFNEYVDTDTQHSRGAGPFETLEKAKEMFKKHRPSAKEVVATKKQAGIDPNVSAEDILKLNFDMPIEKADKVKEQFNEKGIKYQSRKGKYTVEFSVDIEAGKVDLVYEIIRNIKKSSSTKKQASLKYYAVSESGGNFGSNDNKDELKEEIREFVVEHKDNFEKKEKIYLKESDTNKTIEEIIVRDILTPYGSKKWVIVATKKQATIVEKYKNDFSGHTDTYQLETIEKNLNQYDIDDIKSELSEAKGFVSKMDKLKRMPHKDVGNYFYMKDKALIAEKLIEEKTKNKMGKSATIKHENGVYNVYSESGKCLGKGYKTKEEAEKRLKQVEYFKHKSSLKQVVISKMAKIKK